MMNVKLLVVQGRPQGKSLLFPPGEYVFGRGTECHIRPDSDWVSRQHCLFRVTSDDVASVRDLGSRNGTLVNGVRIRTEINLKHGDHLQVGPLVFEVRLEESSGIRKPPQAGDTANHAPVTQPVISLQDTEEVAQADVPQTPLSAPRSEEALPRGSASYP
jgi:pSer/pThr/pTyr-binding forkhead associated (FHA) protein